MQKQGRGGYRGFQTPRLQTPRTPSAAGGWSLEDEASCESEDSCSYGTTAPPARQSHDYSGPRHAESPHNWVPPEELRRINVPVPDGAPYTLFFPIELTNKDYLRRIFDIVAMGIQGTVRRMIGKHRDSIGPIGSKQEPYNFTKTCDLYYLTKHIVDPASAPVYARGSSMLCGTSQLFDSCRCFCNHASHSSASLSLIHVSLIFYSEFRANQGHLVAACNTLKGCRNELMHVNVDSGSLDNVSSSFEAGRRLLSFFPPNEALAALASLEAQFDGHKVFKNQRMAAFGWRFVAPSISADADATRHAATPDAQAAITGADAAIIAMQQVNQDTLTALALLASAVKFQSRKTEEEKQLGHYPEAAVLHKSCLALQGIINSDDQMLISAVCPAAIQLACSSVVALSSAEAAASAVYEFDIAQQMKSKKDEVSTLLNRLTDLSAGQVSPLTQQQQQPQQQRRQEAAPPSRSRGTNGRGGGLYRGESRVTAPAVADPAVADPAVALINDVLLDKGKNSIACCLLRSGNTALIHAMLLVAKTDPPLPIKTRDPPQSFMNMLLLTAFKSMLHQQHRWIQAVLYAGFSAAVLKDAGVDASHLLHAGFTAQQLQDSGFMLADLRAAGFTIFQMKAACSHIPFLVAAGYSISELKSAGFKVAASHLKEAGLCAQQLKAEGFKDVAELKAAGFNLAELNGAGFDNVAELKAAGFSLAELNCNGFNNVSELKAAGFSFAELQDAGFNFSVVS